MQVQTQLWLGGARELARAIRSGQASSREVVAAHLDRIAEVNGAVNAVTAVLADEAIAAAGAADAALTAGEPAGPLHGVPFTVKENIDLAGSPTTQGVRALSGAVPRVDSPQIAHLKAAGAIPIGRTNMPEFAVRWHSANDFHGVTRNPWDPARTPGGSSGGDAAALATGMTPLDIGNDYGGSLRVPSQFCGTAALKPTPGRVPYASSLEPRDLPITIQLYAVQGPMARRVEDLRIAFEAMSAGSPLDPRWVPAPIRGPSQVSPSRVAVTVDPAGQGVDPDVAAGVLRAADALRDAGYIVEEVEPPSIADAADLWTRQVLTETQMMLLPTIEPLVSRDFLEFHRLWRSNVEPLSFPEYMASFTQRSALTRVWSEFQTRWPLVLGPVCTRQPFPAGYDTAGREEVRQLFRSMRLTVAVNLLGLPAAAVPVGVTNGLPQGVQIIGPRFREDLCLDAAQVLEDRLGTITPIDPHA
jgi:amidase